MKYVKAGENFFIEDSKLVRISNNKTFCEIIETRIMDSKTFSNALLKSEKVAVVPGTAFGENSEGFVRMCYATSIKNIKEALFRIKRFLKSSR